MQVKNHSLILMAMGSDPNILATFAKFCAKTHCFIVDMKTQRYQSDYILHLVVQGSWHSIAKLEANISALEKETKSIVHSKRAIADTPETIGLPYQIQIVAKDRAGILTELCNFLDLHAIGIDECTAQTYATARSMTLMCSLQLNVRIPVRTHLATFRDKFLSYCEDRNLDALLEPLKD